MGLGRKNQVASFRGSVNADSETSKNFLNLSENRVENGLIEPNGALDVAYFAMYVGNSGRCLLFARGELSIELSCDLEREH